MRCAGQMGRSLEGKGRLPQICRPSAAVIAQKFERAPVVGVGAPSDPPRCVSGWVFIRCQPRGNSSEKVKEARPVIAPPPALPAHVTQTPGGHILFPRSTKPPVRGGSCQAKNPPTRPSFRACSDPADRYWPTSVLVSRCLLRRSNPCLRRRRAIGPGVRGCAPLSSTSCVRCHNQMCRAEADNPRKSRCSRSRDVVLRAIALPRNGEEGRDNSA